jgi:hypothetical protein
LTWLLQPDSTWRHVAGPATVETHDRLQELALQRRRSA